MDWWIWILLGLVLLLAELVTPGGFYILFFGLGGIAVGLLSVFEAAGPIWFQIVLFSIISVFSLWFFREKLLELTRGPSMDRVDTYIGETAVVLDDISVNGIGKAEMRGTPWNTRNVSGRPLARGERCKVERVEGLTIFVRAETT
ncbi:MAG TPA: NfeD family protein [Candidatus Eisenbacteria bacterium]|jgi:membrane protein implicated in regulation of membrane protease activity|nr:NfeD family protein [Candidatus Eisenbacteria bacterium]